LLEVTGCDASVVISVVIFLIALNGVGFREMKKLLINNVNKN